MPDERESRKERKRQSLLAAAYGLFTEKGVAKTSVDEIVRRANVAKGTFYLYFQDKDQLLQQLGNRTIVQPLSGGESAAARGTAAAKQRSAPVINITINAPAGMDVNALADAVAYRLQTLAGRKEAVW